MPQKRNKGGNVNPNAPAEGGNFQPAESELVVIMKKDSGLRSMGARLSSLTNDVSSLETILEQSKASMEPLFGMSEERIHAMSAPMVDDSAESESIAMDSFYSVTAPTRQRAKLAMQLREHPLVEAAYLKPPAYPPLMPVMLSALGAPAPLTTPDFTGLQDYLRAAPGGVDALYAWTKKGGKGDGITIIDIEGEWRFSHEDLLQNQGGVVGGTPPNSIDWRNHGTAVIGVFGSDANNYGTTGIVSNAMVKAISIFPQQNSARAIVQAAGMLKAGDIILIELHRPGPRYNFESRRDQKGYIAVEWWPEDYQAIKFATGRGVIVVEAGGNGAENLDDKIYDKNPPPPNGPFPPWWRNPYRRSPFDSGAILVGAGAPPPGTHGRDYGPDRSRLDFSNFASIVDAQGWGREVTSTGYGDLQGGPQEDYWYTNQFAGTSSASPIIVGVIGCLQGILKAAGKKLLTPAQARNLLRTTGSGQQDAPGRPKTERIGNRPDLRQLIGRLGI